MTKLTAEDYEQIQHFEKTYGSLMKTPDEKLAMTLWKKFGLSEAQETKDFLTENVSKLVKLGYDANEISWKLRVGKTTVNKYRRLVRVKSIRRFRYRFQINETCVYCNSAQDISKALGYKPCRGSATSLAKKATGKAIDLKADEETHWFEVPDEAVYLTSNGWFVKRGLDSYEREECRYDSQECEAYLAKTRIQQPRRNAKVGGNLR